MRGFSDRRIQGDRARENIQPILDTLNGREVKEGVASIIAVERQIEREYICGAIPLADFYSVDTDLLALLFSPSSHDPSRRLCLDDFLFFDIETTGLSGGAGTYVFLIGLLKAHEGGFRVTQYLLHNLASERLFLRSFREHLHSYPVLVSYNGKSFDYNLIKSREVLNGLAPLENQPVHLDLLYPCRRMWKGMLSDFSLQTVERATLGVERPDDIPGCTIPEIYFRFLKGLGCPAEILKVFHHNLFDILSLPALLIKMASALRWGMKKHEDGRMAESVQCNHVSLSEMFLRNNYTSEALRILKADEQSSEALKRLGIISKRERLFEDAIRYFTRLIKGAEGLSDYVLGCTELAKIYEHSLKDIHKALFYTEKAWKRVRRFELLYQKYARGFSIEEMALKKRLDRLKRKLSLPGVVSSGVASPASR